MKMQMRTITGERTDFDLREEDGVLRLSGYFAVYDPNSVYEVGPGMTESIAEGAFQNSMSGDVRMLINHDTTLVLGRTTAHTLELRSDSHGLWASAVINPKDTAAMDAYARVERGDVSQCSIGFEIIKEDTEVRDDGSIHWTIREARLWECSICTFPAYAETSVSARSAQRNDLMKRRSEAWAKRMKERIRHGAESADDQVEA